MLARTDPPSYAEFYSTLVITVLLKCLPDSGVFFQKGTNVLNEERERFEYMTAVGYTAQQTLEVMDISEKPSTGKPREQS